MKTIVPALFAICAALVFAGCNHLDLTPPGSADRVLNGVVTSGVPADLPADAEVSVSVLDLSRGEAHGEVLGEQTIKNPGSMPVAFHIEYRAEDAQLMRSIDVEARISIGKRLAYITTTRHPITLGNVNDSHVVNVEPASGR